MPASKRKLLEWIDIARASVLQVAIQKGTRGFDVHKYHKYHKSLTAIVRFHTF